MFLKWYLLEGTRSSSFCDTNVVLRGKEVRLNKLIVGLLFPFLEDADCGGDEDLVILMPDYNLEMFQKLIDELLQDKAIENDALLSYVEPGKIKEPKFPKPIINKVCTECQCVFKNTFSFTK